MKKPAPAAKTGKKKLAGNGAAKDRKDRFIRLRITTEAFNRVSARAQAAGYSLGAFCRMKIDEEDDGFRARRRPIAELENMTALLGNLGSIRALHNQMAKQANIHGFDPLTFDEAQEAARKYRDFLYEQMDRDAPPSKAESAEPSTGSIIPGSKFTGGGPAHA